MMAKKCDICGALYELQNEPDICVSVYNHPYYPGKCRWLDLCPACQEKLEEFVCGNGGALKNGSREGEWCANLRADMHRMPVDYSL